MPSKVSEKSLELNVGAELLGIVRGSWGFPKTYLQGLTQKKESQQGVDFFARLGPGTRILAFQFKAPKGPADRLPYRFTLVSEQHRLLHDLAILAPDSVFYVFPFYVTPAKLQAECPTLIQDTWFLPIDQMPTISVFGTHKTKTIACTRGAAVVNPEYQLRRFIPEQSAKPTGIPASQFSTWYRDFRNTRETVDRGTRRSPWLMRGLRIAIVDAATTA